jgi:glycosyltransferase involved in cell wall biosynthesis
MTPKVSIGLPVHNGERFLAEAVESILAQSYGDFELVISDNASTDGTPDICADYARRDRRIRHVRQPENLGAAPNYNYVFERSSAPFFKWAAHDDRIRPGFLDACMGAHESAAVPPALVYSASEFIDETGAVIGPDRAGLRADSSLAAIRAFEVLQGLSLVTAIAGVFRRDALSRTRLIGSFASADYVLLLETAIAGRIRHVEGEPLFQRRVHAAMSRRANVTEQEVLRWFDPKATSTLRPQTRLYLEYLRSTRTVPGPGPFERPLLALAVLSGVAFRRTRVTVGRWRRNVGLVRRRPGRGTP